MWMDKLRSISLLVFVLFFSSLKAQKQKVLNLPTLDDRPIYFGFSLGVNSMDFSFDYAQKDINNPIKLFPDVYRLQPGFQVNMVANLRIYKFLDFKILPGIAFGERRLYFIDDDKNPADYALQKINSSFIEMPLLLKYKAKRINNVKPYFILGINPRLDIASKKDYDEEQNIYIRLKPLDLYYELGFGIDSYLQFFKLSTEIKYSLGSKNLLVNDLDSNHPEYVISLDGLSSRIIMLTFYFEGGIF